MRTLLNPTTNLWEPQVNVPAIEAATTDDIVLPEDLTFYTSLTYIPPTPPPIGPPPQGQVAVPLDVPFTWDPSHPESFDHEQLRLRYMNLYVAYIACQTELYIIESLNAADKSQDRALGVAADAALAAKNYDLSDALNNQSIALYDRIKARRPRMDVLESQMRTLAQEMNSIYNYLVIYTSLLQPDGSGVRLPTPPANPVVVGD